MPAIKSSKKKTIYIVIGSVILLLVIGGVVFYFWKQSKNQNNSSTEDDDDEDDEDDYFPSSPDKYLNPEWGGSKENYKIPAPSSSISEQKAKEEVVKAIHEWGNKALSEPEVEKLLVKNSQRISSEDKKINLNFVNTWDFIKSFEELAKKYWQDVYFNRPDQTKFGEAVFKSTHGLFYLSYNFYLEYKDNGEIDWKASLQTLYNGKSVKKTKTKEEWQKINDYIVSQINFPISLMVKAFPKFTDIKELNNFARVLSIKAYIADFLLYNERWRLAEKMKKKLAPPEEVIVRAQDATYKNKKFDLNPVFNVYKVQEGK